MTPDKAPHLCTSMAELRLEIDVIDSALIDLLVERSLYIDRAVTLKQAEGLPARISHRVEEVIENVRNRARDQGMDPALAEEIWRCLIEWSIAREARHLEA